MSENKLSDYDYSTKEARETTVKALFQSAKNERTQYEYLWKVQNDLYDGHHKKAGGTDENGIDEEDDNPYREICLTDGFIQVESQINPNPMEPVFYGRDFLMDEDKAKQREFVVKFILQNNNFASISTSIERSMKKHGNAFVKCFWDDTMPDGMGGYGEVRIAFVDIDSVFPDPSAKTLEQCEHFNYVYYDSKRAVWRQYKKELQKAGFETISDIPSVMPSDTKVVSDTQQEKREDEVQIVEHWYKDDDGDMACSVQIGGKEVKFITKYWEKTGEQNKNFVFVHFYCLRDERRFWNKSELDVIAPLINAGDKILNLALKNMEFTANDTVLVEEGSVDDPDSITNEPGGIITYKQGQKPPQRLGGLNSLKDMAGDVAFVQGQIERTLRNFDTNQGKIAAKTTTATETMQNAMDTQEQGKKKEYDRKQSYQRLFTLLDWLALEFYTVNKLIFIGVEGAKRPKQYDFIKGNLDSSKGNIYFEFNSALMKVKGKKQQLVHDDETGSDIAQDVDVSYYPSIDCNVVASNAIEKSKSFNVSVIQQLLGTPITADNYNLVVKLIEEIEIEGGQAIIKDIKAKYANPVPLPQGLAEFIATLPSEEQTQLKANPTMALSVYANFLESTAMPEDPKNTVNNAGIA